MADGNFMVTMEMCVFNHDRGVSIHPSVRIDTDDLGEEQVLAVGDMHWKGRDNG